MKKNSNVSEKLSIKIEIQKFMKFPFKLTRAQLKIFSALCTEFVVVWLLAILGTRDLFILTMDVVFAIIF